MRSAALVLLLLAGSALAQAPAQPPAEKKAEPPRERGETSLNLKLDDEGMRGAMRFEPRDRNEKKVESTLPGLGDDARTLERAPATSIRSPFPQDTETGSR